jgi:magnesium-transporting ATPase (P-type)
MLHPCHSITEQETPGSAPLTIVQLLWVNLIMDTLGALALATEPPNDAMMQRPPVGRSDNFITKVMWRNIIGQSIYQLVVLGVLLFQGKALLQLDGAQSDAQLNTFVFNTFVLCQVRTYVRPLSCQRFYRTGCIHSRASWRTTRFSTR